MKIMPDIKRHIPQRTCVACRRTMPKRELNRVVRTTDGNVRFDPSGRMPGRGAYICPECLKDGLKTRALEHTLKTTLTRSDVEQLERFAAEMTR
jgi:predicted RNA-binding protein YlxR (DUF448 family)